MAVFTAEQLAAIDAADQSLVAVRAAVGDATNLIVSLRNLHGQSLIDGKLNGQATFDAALVTWAEIKVRLQAAAQAVG
jgi:hypothetical protein